MPLRNGRVVEVALYWVAVPLVIVALAAFSVFDHYDRTANERRQIRDLQETQQRLQQAQRDNCDRAIAIADYIHAVVIQSHVPNDPRLGPLPNLERKLNEIGGCRPDGRTPK